MNILAIISCIVLLCVDGDTCRVKDTSNVEYKIRLLGIDTPEKWSPKCSAQPYSIVAMNRINELIKGKKVDVYISGLDGYGRHLGYIHYGDMDVNLQMVKEGLAEVYRGKEDYLESPYYPYEEKAKKEEKGMWWLVNEEQYESPRDYRKRCY